MPDSDDDVPDNVPNLSKLIASDTSGIKKMKHLKDVDMENIEEARQDWLALRTELIKELTKKDNIYSHLCDFAKATGNGSFKPKFRITGHLVKLNGQGPPKKISHIAKITQADLRFRAVNIIEDFLPSLFVV